MTTNNPQSAQEKPSPKASASLFDHFPEPQAWPKRWDGTALEMLSRPKSSRPKNKPQA